MQRNLGNEQENAEEDRKRVRARTGIKEMSKKIKNDKIK